MGSTQVPGDAREAELVRMMAQYGDQLVGFCTAQLGDAALAQDVVQETFIRAYKNMDRFRGAHEASEKAWLTRIAVNLCRDHQRSRYFRFVDRSISFDMIPEKGRPIEEAHEQLYTAVQRLPAKYREVILLHYYQDMRIPEIAGTLRLSASSVYRRLEKARQKLKNNLERGGFHA